MPETIGGPPGVLGVLALRAESRHRAHDDVWLHGPQVLVGKIEVSHDARPEVLDHHVADVSQVQKQLAAFRLVEAQGKAQLVAIQLVVGAALAVNGNARVADLDDFGPEISQHPQSQRAGPDPGEVENPYV